MMKLGGGIELVGFKELDRDKLVIVKKMVGNYVKKMGENSTNFGGLTLTMKPIHGHTTEDGTKIANKFEIHGKVVDNGKVHTTETTDFNLFITIDRVLNVLNQEMNKKKN